jgi:peroxiredoxin Q/BCP
VLGLLAKRQGVVWSRIHGGINVSHNKRRRNRSWCNPWHGEWNNLGDSFLVANVYLVDLKALLGWGLPEGARAPDFSLKGADNKLYTLSQFRGSKVLLYFYPQAFTPGCTAQACSLRDGYADLKNRSYVLLGISTDEVSALQGFVQKHHLPFPLLSDSTKKTCKNYSVLMPIIERANRVTFLINEEGIIEKTFRFLVWNRYAQSILDKTAHGPS